MRRCDYGCGNEAKYQFKTGNWCCRKNVTQCPEIRRKITEKVNNLYAEKGSTYNIKKDEIRVKRSISLKNAWKRDNSKWLNEETKKKQRLSNLLSREKGVYSSIDYKNKLKEIHKKIWSNKESSYNSLSRKNKISETMKKLYNDEDYLRKLQKGLKMKPNRAEKIIISILDNIDKEFNFCGNFSEWIGGKNPDFINKKKNKVIELFGEYWHSFDRIGLTKVEHEKERRDHFKKYGYETLIIWEAELRNEEQIKNKIINFLGEK